jgi:hypothetical protein
MDNARRKLLKGSVAAPLMLTVQPAGAYAKASSAMCANADRIRATQTPKPGELTHSDVDDWLRTKIDICELYRHKDLQGMEKIEGKYFLGVDQTYYWRVDDKGPLGITAVKTDYGRHQVVAQRTGEVKHALVYIGPEGSPTGYAWERYGGSPMTQSCWHSFRVLSKPRWWG